MKKLREIVEATKSLHPMALHVKPVMVNGQQKYKVHAVGGHLADGIKHGEHLSDSELDDAHEMGAKIKHVKEEVQIDESWIVHDSSGKLIKKFSTHKAAKAHAEKTGHEYASAEFYHDKIQKKVNEGKMAELDHDLENMKDKDFETYYGKPKSDFKSAKKPMSEPKPSNVKEAMSHQASTTMKHIPNASPALKKAAKDIKPGIAGFRDRIAMLKAGGVKEETIIEKITVVQGVAPASHNNKPTTSGGITSGTVYTGRPKPNTPKPDTVKPNRGNTQFRPASDGPKPGAQSALDQARSRMKNTKEETDFGPEADKNITVQLKKAMDMMEHGEKSGSEIEFADGQKYFVEGVVAHKVLVAMEQMKPEIRAQAQNAVYQSFAHLMAAHQMLSK